MNDVHTEIDTTQRRSLVIGEATVPIDQYVSEKFYAGEASSVWRRSWLLLGRDSEIPDAGDYLVFDLQVANASILVIRDRDGGIRAFYNACIHRGARLRDDAHGSCKALSCPFHGWVYGFDGKLLDVPMRELFEDLDWKHIGLKSIDCDTWGGFVFVHLDPEPEHRLEDYLQPLPEALRDYLATEDWRWYSGYKTVIDCNWKIPMDGQIEGHHAPFLHRRTIGGAFTPQDIPHYVYPHSPSVMSKIAVSRPPMPSGAIKQTGVAQAAIKYSKSAMWTEKDTATASAHTRYPGAINTAGSERWVFDLYVVFPNITFLLEDDQFIVQRVWPLGPHRTAFELDHYFVGQAATFGEVFNRELGFMQELDTITEDINAATGVHGNLRSGALSQAHLSDLEIGISLYHSKIRAMAEQGQ